MRKNLFLLLLVSFFITLFLTGCQEPASFEEVDQEYANIADSDDNRNLSLHDEIESIDSELVVLTETTEEILSFDDHDNFDGVGGILDECGHHVFFFHSHNFFHQLAEGWLDINDVVAWDLALREIEWETGECLVNMFTFIQHFNLPREAFLNLFEENIWWYFRYGGDALDILYSGNWALIDQFFSHDGGAWAHAWGRENRHFSEQIMALQQEVLENTDEMSRYFHDVGTWSHFSNGKDRIIRWMQSLIDAGEYNRVNIVEFIEELRLRQSPTQSPGTTAFEHWAIHDNMNIFTHYNLDILLSGDMNLIRQYYAIENEPLHTAAVQSRFAAHVARYGMPDVSWMMPEYRFSEDDAFFLTIDALVAHSEYIVLVEVIEIDLGWVLPPRPGGGRPPGGSPPLDGGLLLPGDGSDLGNDRLFEYNFKVVQVHKGDIALGSTVDIHLPDEYLTAGDRLFLFLNPAVQGAGVMLASPTQAVYRDISPDLITIGDLRNVRMQSFFPNNRLTLTIAGLHRALGITDDIEQ